MNEVSFIILLFAGFAFVSSAVFKRKKKPKETEFTCRRCAKKTTHSGRTIEAWRKGLNTFYCNPCHALWLQNQARNKTNPVRKKITVSESKGCLGIILIFIGIPIFFVAWILK